MPAFDLPDLPPSNLLPEARGGKKRKEKKRKKKTM